MARCLIVGGGVIGTAHARLALKQGYEVIHLERDSSPKGASLRNFGLIWISGRAGGAELEASLRTRELWDEIHHEIPEMDFRANGSLTLAQNEAELHVMQEALLREDAELRKWQILDPVQTRAINPELRGKYLASLWCPLDATVEPGYLLATLRKYLLTLPQYSWRPGVEICAVEERPEGVVAITQDGEKIVGDLLIICPGADHTSLFKDELTKAPLRKVRLQMASTAVFDGKLTTSIADGDSMRYYPAYDLPGLAQLPPQHPVASANNMQLLCVQRSDGTLTIGDTHEFEEPFEFKIREDVYQYLHQVASDLIGQKLPPFEKRWEGIYSQRSDGAICDRNFISSKIITVTGAGGRGNTLAPVIAEMTFKEIS